MKKSRISWIIGLAAAGALLLGACSSGSDDDASNGDDSSVSASDDSGESDDGGDSGDGGGGDISDDLRQDGIDSMLADGLDQATAECMVDGMIDAFGSDIVDIVDDESFEPTAEQTAALIEVTTDCGALEDVLNAAE